MNTVCGFINKGSTCYFNSLLQSLLSCSHVLEETKKKGEDNILSIMINDFCSNPMKDPHFSSFFLEAFLKTINGSFSGQQSASEFFVLLIDKMKLDSLFLHQYESETTCTTCNNRSIRIDKMIDSKIFYVEGKDIFDEMNNTKEEIHGYTCEKCKKKTTANISRSIINLPSIFCINFTNKYSNNNPKLIYPVSFETSKETKYNLVATIEHFGNINSGHFCARVRRGNEFFIVDDMGVSKISNIPPEHSTYMIFYEKEKEKEKEK